MNINEEVFHKILKRTLHNEINGNEIDPVTLLYDIYAILMDDESALKEYDIEPTKTNQEEDQ